MRATVTAITGFLLFWVGITIAATQFDGYSPLKLPISVLAAYGSPAAVLGVSSILLLGASHYVAAVATWPGSRVAAVFVAIAATFMIGVGVVRGGCPEGPGVCARTNPQEVVDNNHLHGVMVNYYQLFMLAATVTLLVVALRAGRIGWAAATAALLLGSLLLFGGLGFAEHPGLRQRLWLTDNLLVLVVSMLAVNRRSGARERQAAGV